MFKLEKSCSFIHHIYMMLDAGRLCVFVCSAKHLSRQGDILRKCTMGIESLMRIPSQFEREKPKKTCQKYSVLLSVANKHSQVRSRRRKPVDDCMLCNVHTQNVHESIIRWHCVDFYAHTFKIAHKKLCFIEIMEQYSNENTVFFG